MPSQGGRRQRPDARTGLQPRADRVSGGQISKLAVDRDDPSYTRFHHDPGR